jgi:hypothetical protein
VKLPLSIIRYGGWLLSVTKSDNRQLKSKLKKYWYGVGEGKVVIVPNIQKEGKKKIRVRQAGRIG